MQKKKPLEKLYNVNINIQCMQFCNLLAQNNPRWVDILLKSIRTLHWQYGLKRSTMKYDGTGCLPSMYFPCNLNTKTLCSILFFKVDMLQFMSFTVSLKDNTYGKAKVCLSLDQLIRQ